MILYYSLELRNYFIGFFRILSYKSVVRAERIAAALIGFVLMLSQATLVTNYLKLHVVLGLRDQRYENFLRSWLERAWSVIFLVLISCHCHSNTLPELVCLNFDGLVMVLSFSWEVYLVEAHVHYFEVWLVNLQALERDRVHFDDRWVPRFLVKAVCEVHYVFLIPWGDRWGPLAKLDKDRRVFCQFLLDLISLVSEREEVKLDVVWIVSWVDDASNILDAIELFI